MLEKALQVSLLIAVLGHAALLLQPMRTLLGSVPLLRMLAAITIGSMAFGADALLLLFAAEALPRMLLFGSAGVIISMLPRLRALRLLASLDKLALRALLRLATLGILRDGASLRFLARLDVEPLGAPDVAVWPLIALLRDTRGLLALRTLLLSRCALLLAATAVGLLGLTLLRITPRSILLPRRSLGVFVTH